MQPKSKAARRVIFGQSRAGYFVLYSAFAGPDLFWGRIASNPGWNPGRELFLSTPAPAIKNDLGLVVTSGSRDAPNLRKSALEWFTSWEGRTKTSWQVKTLTLDGGTHAAGITNSYRAGVVWLFGRDGNAPRTLSTPR